MKKAILFCLLLAATTLIKAQALQLPGMGSNQVSVNASQLTSSTALVFGNPEYNITGFTISFPTSTNPSYSAISTNNHLTADMLTNLQNRIPGSAIQMQITLQAPGEHAPWNKSYVLNVAD